MIRATNARTLVRGLRLDRERQAHERWSQDRLESHQAAQLRALIADAMSRSPFYRARYAEAGVGPHTPLEGLPVLTKAELMEHWDEIVTDRGLRLADARAAVERGDGWLRGHQVMGTGGSSRTFGVFAFDRPAWDVVVANALRAQRLAGVGPRLPRWRIALVYAPSGRHMAARVSSQLDVGAFRFLRLPASAPMGELAAALERFRPEVLNGYAGVVGALAAEALDGGLRIKPQVVIGSSEPLTAVVRERVRAAWGVEPFDWYATTESGGILGCECAEHTGLHVQEDAVILEPQDRGILVTNLANRLLPLIRFEVGDLVRWADGDCRCGLPFRRLAGVSGRADDVLMLPAHAGGTVAVHPTAWSGVAGLPQVAELEVVHRGEELAITVAARGDCDAAAGAALSRARADLGALGIDLGRVALRVDGRAVLPRTEGTGKRKVVRVEEPSAS